jgi:hypothetical protein
VQDDDPTSPDEPTPGQPTSGEPTPDDVESGFWDDLGFAEGADVSTREARPWRMAALAAGTCLVAIVVAIILLQVGGGGSNKDVGLPITTDGPSSPALITSPGPTNPTSTQRAHPITRPSTSARPTRSRTRTSTASTSQAPTTASSTAHPSQPPSSTPAPPSTSHVPQPSVFLAKGPRDYLCGPRCFFLQVTLTNLPGGHHVVCEARSRHAQTATAFSSYDTTSPTSTVCSFDGQHDSVFVVVDDIYHSNTITW